MQNLRWLLNICGALVGLFLVFWVIGIIATTFRIIWYKIKGYAIDKGEFEIYSPIYIFRYFTRNSDDKKVNTVMLAIFIIGLISIGIDVIKASPLATTTIGSLIEKKEYTEYYYVNMYPEDDYSKKYKVKAEIECRQDILEGEEGNGDSFYYHGRQYYITEAFMPNGSIITFSDDYQPLELNEKVLEVDDNDEWWGIELTKEKAK